MTEGNLLLSLLNDILYLIKSILGLFSSLIIGFILAYFLNPLVVFFEEKLKSRAVAMVISYMTIFAALLALVYGFVILIIGALPKGGISKTVSLLSQYFTDAFKEIEKFASIALSSDSAALGLSVDSKEMIDRWIENNLSLSSAVEIIKSLSGGLISLFLGIVASIYLIKDKEFFLRLWGQFLSLITTQKTHGAISEILEKINLVLSTFLKATFIDSLIVAFLSSIALTMVKVKYAVIIGIIAGILNVIPYFGPFFGTIPAFLVAFFQAGPGTAGLAGGALAVISLVIVQQLDSNYIYPKIVGTSIGLHPLFVLISVSVFGYLGGIVGMLLAVPLAGIIQIFVNKWAESK